MDNFKIIYKILSTLEKSMDLEKCPMECIAPEHLKISVERWGKYMEMLCDTAYVKGVKIQRYITGETSVNVKDIQITLKGLEYLSENSIMQKMYKATKGITDLVERDSKNGVVFNKQKLRRYREHCAKKT